VVQLGSKGENAKSSHVSALRVRAFRCDCLGRILSPAHKATSQAAAINQFAKGLATPATSLDKTLLTAARPGAKRLRAPGKIEIGAHETRVARAASAIDAVCRLSSGAKGVNATHFRPHKLATGWQRHDRAFVDVATQLKEYFDGRRRVFELPLAPEGTPFQLRVWNALLEIPYGETISYGELAARIGDRSASRAVGLANGSNPLPIVIPCHRVIGSNGKLTGYGGGLPIKERLLALEGALPSRTLFHRF
jgi:methylated-DNA-[protein]-cysteine S-methyltransferase